MKEESVLRMGSYVTSAQKANVVTRLQSFTGSGTHRSRIIGRYQRARQTYPGTSESILRSGLSRKKTYKIQIDPTVTPVVNPPRKLPAALSKRVKKALSDMKNYDVIRKVDEPTDWVNSMVIVEKPNKKLRICIDPRDLNTAIKREHFQLPTIEGITSRLTGAKVFSKLDGKNSYWQLKLDPESIDCLFEIRKIAVCFLWLSLPCHYRVTDEALLAETT